MKLRPFFSFYGAKWRAAPKYPRPLFDTIVEPFAGSAGYSLRYPERRIVLVERDPVIAGLWRYLISAKPSEIRALPLIEVGQSVDDLDVCDDARSLIGFWCNQGAAQPRKTISAWGKSHPKKFWGVERRERVASQVAAIKHWTVIEGDYFDAPDIAATWFVDPPYQVAGRYYRHGSDRIDFGRLGAWCRTRPGQTIVCENTGADWLPFRHWRDVKSNQANSGGRTTSAEAIWTRYTPDALRLHYRAAAARAAKHVGDR